MKRASLLVLALSRWAALHEQAQPVRMRPPRTRPRVRRRRRLLAQSAPEESTPSDNATDNARLAAVLPRGMSSQEACRGFTSLDLCAATLPAAQNLNVPFADLKGQVVAGQGLGAAIHTVKPSVDANAEATRAKVQAQQGVRAPHG